MFSNYKEDRFVTVYRNGKPTCHTIEKILKDTKTGVLYFEKIQNKGVTIIPLLDSDGKPLVEAD